MQSKSKKIKKKKVKEKALKDAERREKKDISVNERNESTRSRIWKGKVAVV